MSDFAQFYNEGPLKNLDQIHRFVGTARRRIFRVNNQPAGAVEVPGAMRSTLQVAISGSGVGRFDLGAGRFEGRSRPGDWVVTPIGSPCRYDLQFDLGLIVLELDDIGQEDRMGQGDVGPLHSRLFHEAAVSQLARMVWEDALGEEPLGVLWSDCALVTLQGLLRRTAGSVAAPSPARGGLAPLQARRVKEYLAAHFDRSVSLVELAEVAGLSTYHFARMFKQSLGCPPHTYQTRLRIDRAQDLLKHTRVSVTQIAFAVGYESSQALARAFMREVGTTPSAWRQEHHS